MRQQDCSVVTDYGGNKFGSLRDVAIGVNDEVVVVDVTNKCVIVLDCNMTLLSVIGNNKGNKNGQFDGPRGLVFSGNKMLHIVDGGNYRVQVFQQDDKFAFTFGSRGSNPGQFQWPVRIAIDTDNKVLVSDYDDNHISLFSRTGSFISRITCSRPWVITVSPDGHIIAGCICDSKKIKIWSPTHQLVNQFGEEGSQQGEFYGTYGIVMTSTGTIYAVEYANRRLQVIS